MNFEGNHKKIKTSSKIAPQSLKLLSITLEITQLSGVKSGSKMLLSETNHGPRVRGERRLFALSIKQRNLVSQPALNIGKSFIPGYKNRYVRTQPKTIN